MRILTRERERECFFLFTALLWVKLKNIFWGIDSKHWTSRNECVELGRLIPLVPRSKAAISPATSQVCEHLGPYFL